VEEGKSPRKPANSPKRTNADRIDEERKYNL